MLIIKRTSITLTTFNVKIMLSLHPVEYLAPLVKTAKTLNVLGLRFKKHESNISFLKWGSPRSGITINRYNFSLGRAYKRAHLSSSDKPKATQLNKCHVSRKE